MKKYLLFAITLFLISGCAPFVDSTLTEDSSEQNKLVEDFFAKYDVFYSTSDTSLLMKNDQSLGQYDNIEIYSDGEYIPINNLSEDTYYDSAILNEYEILFNGNRYEVYMNKYFKSDENFFREGDYVIYFTCLAKEYNEEFDTNRCVKEALYANDQLIYEHNIDWIVDDSDLLGQLLGNTYSGNENLLYVYFIDYPNVYYAEVSDEYLRYYNLETGENGQSEYLSDGAEGLYQGKLLSSNSEDIDLSDTSAPRLTSYFLDGDPYSELSLAFGVLPHAEVINDSIYIYLYDALEDRITTTLIKDKLKVAVITMIGAQDSVIDGNKSFCTFNALSSGSYCILGDNIIAKSGYGSYENEDDKDFVDQYLLNGSEISFYPYWTTDGQNEELERVTAVSFVPDDSGNINYLLVGTTNLSGVGWDVYLVEYLGDGRIGEPSLLLEGVSWLYGAVKK